MPLLQVESIVKSFGNTTVLHDVSFSAQEGEILCLLGPSGCGKTTLLRIIAGLEAADSGQVSFEGQTLDDVPAHRRGFGLMFQDFALFPHKNVAANVAFGLRMQSRPPQEIEAHVNEMLALVGLEGYGQRRVYELSGGEQQRVALARSLAPGPRLLMLDEPLGSLDRALREGLMNELRTILKQIYVTALYVTHDQQEAFALSDRVIVMDRGRIVQIGTPEDVYRHPATAWVARFLGLTNLIPGRVIATEPLRVDTPLGCLEPGKVGQLSNGQEVTLLIRPEAAMIVPEPTPDSGPFIRAEVGECSFRGSHCRLVVQHQAGLKLVFELLPQGTPLPRPGEQVALALRPGAISLLAEERYEQP
jgi:ABC-type Fe3+/spermidine/putrescine transport system ATPase subunit